MSRSAHTYALDGVEVVLNVPEGLRVPRLLPLRETASGRPLEFEHAGVKPVRATSQRKPRQVSPLTKITEDWAPPADAVEKIRDVVPSVDVEFETEQFVLWALGKGEARADWVASWRKWMRSTHQRNVEKGWKPKAPARTDETAKERWIRTHGLTVEEYEEKKGDPEWLEMIKRRGVVV